MNQVCYLMNTLENIKKETHRGGHGPVLVEVPQRMEGTLVGVTIFSSTDRSGHRS